MPIKSKKTCICTRCGKKFIIKTGDNINSKDLNSMLYCSRCKLILLFKRNSL